jgi:hypothetical protein
MIHPKENMSGKLSWMTQSHQLNQLYQYTVLIPILRPNTPQS